MEYFNLASFFRSATTQWFSAVMVIVILSGQMNLLQAQNWLKKAEDNYESGQIEKIPEIVDKNIKKEQLRENIIQGKRLNILAHLYDDEFNKADSAMLNLLTYEKEYKLLPEDSATEFEFLYQTYRTTPVLAYGFFAGTNFSKISVSEEFGVHNLNNDDLSYTGSAPGFHVGISAHVYLDRMIDNLQLNLDVSYKQKTFTYNNRIYDFASLSIEEIQTWVYVPLTLSYSFDFMKNIKTRSNIIKNTSPFLKIGIAGGYMLSDNAKPLRTYTDNSHSDVKGSDISMIDLRKKMNGYLTGGIGFKHKVRMGYLFVEGNYHTGLSSFTEQDARYSNPELLFNYFYVDNSMALNNISISAGFVRLLYNPKKKDKVKKYFLF